MSRFVRPAFVFVPLAASLLAAGCSDTSPNPVVADAGTDSGSALGCTPLASTYTEQHDSTNDVNGSGTAEATSLTANIASSVTIGGCIDTTYASSTAADVDAYSLHIAGTAQWLVSRYSRALGSVMGGDLHIQLASTSGTINLGAIVGTNAQSAAVLLPPGDYTLTVTGLTGTGSGAYPYQLELWTTICSGAVIDASYAEAADGTTSRGNDVLAVDGAAANPFSATPGADAAEPSSGVPISAGQTIQITGTSAAIASDGDSYLDRDSFNIAPATGVGQLLATVSWATAADDLDVVFMNGAAMPITANFEATSPSTSLAVPASAGDLRTLWIGNAVGGTATTYTATICAIDGTPP